jgi:hypothetical protein
MKWIAGSPGEGAKKSYYGETFFWVCIWARFYPAEMKWIAGSPGEGAKKERCLKSLILRHSELGSESVLQQNQSSQRS